MTDGTRRSLSHKQVCTAPIEIHCVRNTAKEASCLENDFPCTISHPADSGVDPSGDGQTKLGLKVTVSRVAEGSENGGDVVRASVHKMTHCASEFFKSLFANICIRSFLEMLVDLESEHPSNSWVTL